MDKNEIALLEALDPRLLLSGDMVGTAFEADRISAAGHYGNVGQTAVEKRLVGFGGAGTQYGTQAPNPAEMVSGTYMLTDDWGGTLADAEKSPIDAEDDQMCWAAASSNVLEWTGWGHVNGMTTTDQMFQYFQDHWTNGAGQVPFGWDWWFDGVNDGPAGSTWSHVDVPGGGFYVNETFADYYDFEGSSSDAMAAIDAFQHAGYGTALGLDNPNDGGHAVTCWGYSYNPSEPTDYRGVWLTDSDDDKASTSPPDELRYYEVYFKGANPGGRWFLKDYYGSDGYSIKAVWALDRNPNHRPDLYSAGDTWSWFAPDQVQQGAPWEAHFDIRNGSTAAAGTFYVDFYASKDTTITNGDYFLGRVTISGLAPGDKANADLVLGQLPFWLPAGSYHVGIIIDPTDMVDEFDETNNTAVVDDFPLQVKEPPWAGLKNKIWVDRNPLGPWVSGPRTMWPEVAGQYKRLDGGVKAAAEAVETRLVGFAGPGNEHGPTPDNPQEKVTGTYMLTDHWGGTLADAEKNDNDAEDDRMCWAATASNILEWTGWGHVNGMMTTDEMFQYFQDHWTDDGGRMRYGWNWWFEGAYYGPWTPGWAQVDVPGGGFYPTETFGDYFHWESTDADAMAAIDTFLHAGYGTTLGLAAGGLYGHAVTVWGYTFNPSDPNEYFGIWISDSDDNEPDGSPPDVLTYYAVAYDNNRWYLQNYPGTNAWYIDRVDALDRNPNHRPDLVDAGEKWSGFAPDEVQHGAPWEAHFDIRNTSIADAGTFYVDFYASKDTAITTGDYFLGRVTVLGVAAGDRANADLVLSQFPLTPPAGTYYVGIIIDPAGGMVDEFDETNNTAVDTDNHPLQVRALPRFGIGEKIWVDRNPLGPWVSGPRTMRADVIGQFERIDLAAATVRPPTGSAEPAVGPDVSNAQPGGDQPLGSDALPPVAHEVAGRDAPVYHLDGPDAIRHLDVLCSLDKLGMIQWMPAADAHDMDWGDLGGHTDSVGEGQLVQPLEKFADRDMRRTWRRLSSGKLFFRLGADVPGDLEALFDELEDTAEA